MPRCGYTVLSGLHPARCTAALRVAVIHLHVHVERLGQRSHLLEIVSVTGGWHERRRRPRRLHGTCANVGFGHLR